MTAILGLLPLLVSGQQLTLDPPDSLMWGQPVTGLRLGYRILYPKNAPPIFRTWLKNDTDHPIVVVAINPEGPPPTPVHVMTSKDRDRMMWKVSPPAAYPTRTFGSVWQIRVPAHGVAPVQVSQFRYPVPVGSYVFGTRFEAAFYTEGDKKPMPVALEGPTCTVDVTANLAARSAGY